MFTYTWFVILRHCSIYTLYIAIKNISFSLSPSLSLSTCPLAVSGVERFQSAAYYSVPCIKWSGLPKTMGGKLPEAFTEKQTLYTSIILAVWRKHFCSDCVAQWEASPIHIHIVSQLPCTATAYYVHLRQWFPTLGSRPLVGSHGIEMGSPEIVSDQYKNI